jgi:hypothetical protein
MANIPLQSISFPGLSDKYTTPVVDNTLTQAGAAADAKKTGDEIGAIKNDLSEKADKTDAYSAYIVETETGSIAPFTDGADDVPVKDLAIAIEPVQSGSGDPSPENIRPISGWTGANVSANGINQWDEDWTVGRWSEQHGVLNPAFTSYVASKNKIPVKPNTTYYFRVDFSGATAREIVYFDADKNWISDANSVYADAPFTTPNNCYYIAFNLGGGYGATYNHNVSINYPSTDYDYHAYNGSSVSVNWQTEAGTVYGGTLDVTTGVLTVNSILMQFTGDENESWTKVNGTGSGHLYYRTAINSVEEWVDVTDDICSHFPVANVAVSTRDVGFRCINSTTYGVVVAFRPDIETYDTVAKWKEYLATQYSNGTPVTCVGYVSNGNIYNLTPTEVSTLLGQNNIWSDTGNVTVQYRADTKLYIDKVLNA